MRRTSPIRKVILVLRMTGAAGRDLMTGVFRYAQANRHWNIRLFQMPDALTPEMVRQFEREDVDGIIASELGIAGAPDLLAKSKIPLVVVGPREKAIEKRTDAIAFVRNDEREIGRAAARHFLGLGQFRTFAFVPARGDYFWSKERAIGFRDHLMENGFKCHYFNPVAPSGSAMDRAALERWLKDLPKPVAIMAAWDYRATQVMDALNNLKIAIPAEAAILGVDNDELLCDFTNPPLTSILPDHEHAGYRSAEELNRLMNARGKPCKGDPRVVFCHLKGIVQRESTKAISPAAHLVERTLAYIEKNAVTGISVRDVVTHLGCSRRLADMRFRQLQHQSILEALHDRRLAEVCTKLKKTKLPLATISRQCGFENPKRLMRLFKERFGMTMRDWRKENAPKRTDLPSVQLSGAPIT